MNCSDLIGDVCQIATHLAGGLHVIPDLSACRFCTESAKPPQGLNEVTVSLALGRLAENPDRRLALFKSHGHLLRREPSQPRQPTTPDGCTHRGARVGMLNCGCPGTPIVFACRLHARCVLDIIPEFRDGPIILDAGGQTVETYAPWTSEPGDTRNAIGAVQRLRACSLCESRA